MNDIESIANYMCDNNLHLVTAESCTAGLIAARLVDAPGAGEILDCAFVTYSPSAKLACLDVKDSTIEEFGLTSEEVSIEMAQGALARSQANVAVANTGVTETLLDGPPAGTQCFAWVFKMPDATERTFTETQRFHGARNEIRASCADFALQKLVQLHTNLTITARNTAMTKAKLEPGDKTITPAAKPETGKSKQHKSQEKDVLPELGLKRPDKAERDRNAASPLDPDIDLG